MIWMLINIRIAYSECDFFFFFFLVSNIMYKFNMELLTILHGPYIEISITGERVQRAFQRRIPASHVLPSYKTIKTLDERHWLITSRG